MTVTVNYRRERLRRGWLDLIEDAEAGVWGLTWAPDFAEPDWPGHTYSPEDGDLPSDYPDAAADAASNGGGSTSGRSWFGRDSSLFARAKRPSSRSSHSLRSRPPP